MQTTYRFHRRYLIWDFDGTLAFRPGMWDGALLEILQQSMPHMTVPREQLRAYLSDGFPWHASEVPHCHLCSADDWWLALEPVFQRAFRSVGVDASHAEAMARQVRQTYCNPSGWRLFDDTLPALNRLAEQGWTHLILSNHVPELQGLVRHLGLEPFFECVVNSAETGYEKPHPRAFREALSRLEPNAPVWMIGDNPQADIRGAEAVGIPAILVRTAAPEVDSACPDLLAVVDFLRSVQGGAA